MSERWARAVLSSYRWAGAAAFPFVGTYVGWRASRGMEDRARRHERYGRAGLPRPDGPLIWVHAAREGETVTVIGLVERLLGMGISIVLTTGTVASAEIVRERLGDRVIHQFVPLDLKPALSRFLVHWQPDLALFAESEIWPMTVLELGARRVPQVLVNGRMSDRAFDAWRRRPTISEALFENFAMVIAQSEQDAERFRSLGARPVAVSGNLKTDTTPPPVDELELRRVGRELADRPMWAALCTVDGEERVAGEVHKLLAKRHPGLVTLVMPKERQRADAIELELTALGLNVARRGRKDKITDKTHVILGDAPAETGLYLRLVDIAFIGNSLAGGGGTNPLDAAMLRTALLAGQDISYHRDLYQPLIDRGGVRLVRDRDMLAGAVNFLLRNDKACAEIANAGHLTAESQRGALDKTVRMLDTFIRPLVMQARLQGAAARR